MTTLSFDPARVPFSRAGAWMALTLLTEEVWGRVGFKGAPRLALRVLHGDAPDYGRAIDLTPLYDGDCRYEADAERLRIVADTGVIEFAFRDARTLVVSGEGLGLRLEASQVIWYDNLQPDGPDGWTWMASAFRSEFKLRALSGQIAADAPWTGMRADHIRVYAGGDGLPWVLEIGETWWRASEPAPIPHSWADWLARIPAVPAEWEAARQLAAYVGWSALVEPQGHFTRPAMLMSKNWMASVWSWDHCFNALALAPIDAGLAWDQYRLPFDLQASDGRLPDQANDRRLFWNFVKPPVHGWTLRRLIETGVVSDEKLAWIYSRLAAWTEWWMRDRGGDAGLPFYRHGNDSGWDNATPFKIGMPVAGPDLAAMLVIQMDVLGEVAAGLGRLDEAEAWRARADTLLARLIERLWTGETFVARRVSDGAVHASDSLVAVIPIILGERLPAAILAALVAKIGEPGRFLCSAGLATEALTSPQHESDGYWRGPVWAPTTLLVVEGLRAVGERALAHDIARRFCETCARSGMAENFDAVTRAPLRDHAYSWTASVFLLLAASLR
ncbi:hypothetical protein FMM06_06445 [Glacieibacterium frigidum]|uniref:Mannosylglycerate hydrolase MGH1-like glycoside hydrolase domain-containing protein n=1 Tax=Glacieibacterium frigidum TaxID=2593303 RepID=A0A552UHS0_9SPHN|nr:hypothetical protein FMM06_06445 [Glacieibacterium frigidum]